MKKVVIAIPHSHTWFWSQTCLASLTRNPPVAKDCECSIVVIDNSPWSPAIRGVSIEVLPNYKANRFHASALDCIVESCDFDYLMAWETDVLALRSSWLQWFMNQMRPTDFAVGHWHHEQFVNPSCTLYRGDVLRSMAKWCKKNPEPEILRWGPNFENTQDIAARQPERDYSDWYDNNIEWIAGPFADKRGWPCGTVLKEQPSGQLKGPGWYEPGQMLHHWAVENGYTYTVCSTLTTQTHLPLQTLYGASMPDPQRQLEAAELFGNAETAHMWGGTRALDIVKHEVTCNFVKSNTPFWLEREARYWRDIVPLDIRVNTLKLIRTYGWHYRGAGTPEVTDRDKAAVEYIRSCYKNGGVEW
jgi:hypothetical protein